MLVFMGGRYIPKCLSLVMSDALLSAMEHFFETGFGKRLIGRSSVRTGMRHFTGKKIRHQLSEFFLRQRFVRFDAGAAGGPDNRFDAFRLRKPHVFPERIEDDGLSLIHI